MTSNATIHPEHLARPAIVYVRQSTLDQVRHHQESRRRQYDLAEHARALGWREVLVIDEDLGKSGATAADRAGFFRRTLTLTGRGERMRASGPVERVVMRSGGMAGVSCGFG